MVWGFACAAAAAAPNNGSHTLGVTRVALDDQIQARQCFLDVLLAVSIIMSCVPTPKWWSHVLTILVQSLLMHRVCIFHVPSHAPEEEELQT